MLKVIYDTGAMDVGGKRNRQIVSKTDKGISVDFLSLYSDEKDRRLFFRDGEYPELPKDWDSVVNDYGTTAADEWIETLIGLMKITPEDGGIKPYRTI